MAETPTLIGRYQIRQRLGEGGMGVVYLAHDPAMDSDVAIKLLRDALANADLRKRFAREAQMARRVGVHPNVVTIFDIGDHDGYPFIAMEYVAGETLERVIRPDPPPRLRALRIVEELCTGLTHAHRAGLVHRDIKPANIMLTDSGTVKILDFGIARMAESDLTADGIVIGALNYMSPEQMTGMPIDSRSDVFAVGALFYELLSGKRAFPGSLHEGLPYRIIHGNPPPLAELVHDLDPEIERIVSTALQKDPTKRYQDIATMRHEIARVRRRLEATEIDRAVSQARNALDTGDFEAASLCCEEASRIDPDEPRVIDLAKRVASARSGAHLVVDPAAAGVVGPAGAGSAGAINSGELPTVSVMSSAPTGATSFVTGSGPTWVPTPVSPATAVPSATRVPPAAPMPLVRAQPAGTALASPARAARAPRPAVPPPAAPARSRVAVIGIGAAAVLAAGTMGWFATRSFVAPSVTRSPAAPPQSTSSQSAAPLSQSAASQPTGPPQSTAVAQPAAQVVPPAHMPTPAAGEPVEAPSKRSTSEAAKSEPAKPETPPPLTPEARENARLIREARELYANGHRGQALEIVDAKLAKKEVDPAWRGIIRSWHQQAAANVANARVEAEGKQAATKAETQYRQALEAEESSRQLGKAGDASGALRRFWEAEELYVKAGEQSDIASQAPPPKVTPATAAPPPRVAATPTPASATPASNTAAAATSKLAAPAGVPAANPEMEIRRLMREFQQAWNRRDADGVRRAFPNFAGDDAPRFQNFMIQFQDIVVKVNGTHAAVETVVQHAPRAGVDKGRFHTNEMIFRFEQRDGRWVMLGNQPVQPPGQQQQRRPPR